MECPHCGAANKPDSRYCGECGRPLGRPIAITCPLCDTINLPGITVCTECGANLIPPGVSPAEISLGPVEAADKEPEPEGPVGAAASDEGQPLEEIAAFEGEVAPGETGGETVPPWVQKLKGLDAEGPGEESQEDAGLPGGQVPGWLEVSPDYEDLLNQAAPAEGTGAAEPGDIPSWLERLRPEDAEPFEATEGSAELGEPAGVLKGIRGALGIEPVLAIPRRASSTVAVLGPATVDEGGELFASVVREPALPGLELARSRRVERLAASGVRWINHLILLAAVAVPLLLGSTWSVANLSPTDTAMEMYETIESLPPAAVVLVSHDYDPGGAGEMIPQARAVLDHLMGRGIRLVNVSLTPEGSRLSERLLEEVAEEHGYRPGEDYVSVGYVMGVEAGPRAVVEGLLAARAGDLATGLEDVSLVVEFAGAPEYLRLWLEQVQGPYGVPMVAGVSGTADPFARPYFRNESQRQLSGLITGFVGAAEYERLSGEEGLATAGMDAQSLAHVAIVLVIVVGNVAYFSERMRARLAQ